MGVESYALPTSPPANYHYVMWNMGKMFLNGLRCTYFHIIIIFIASPAVRFPRPSPHAADGPAPRHRPPLPHADLHSSATTSAPGEGAAADGGAAAAPHIIRQVS